MCGLRDVRTVCVFAALVESSRGAYTQSNGDMSNVLESVLQCTACVLISDLLDDSLSGYYFASSEATSAAGASSTSPSSSSSSSSAPKSGIPPIPGMPPIPPPPI